MEVTSCSFCNKKEDRKRLINLKTKVPQFEADLSVISCEVLSIPITEGLICEECKINVISSYQFKIKAATAMSGIREPSDIVRKVNIFVNSVGHRNLSVMQFSQCLAIVPISEKVFMEYNGWREYEIANVPNSIDDDMVEVEISDDDSEDSVGFLDQLDIKEEMFSQRTVTENESQFCVLEDIFGDEGFPDTSSKKRGPRQKCDSWMRSMMSKSKKLVTVGSETTTIYTCCICEKVQCSTYTGMKVHIAKYHQDEKKIFYGKDTKRSTETPVQELKDRATPKHHDLDHLWIESMVKKSDNERWLCGVCNVFISNKPRGVKIHIIRSHCESNNYHSRSDRDSKAAETPNTSTNGTKEINNAEPEKHDYDLQWIKEKIEESQTTGAFGVWTCCICNKYRGTSVVGMKIHIAKTHCKNKNEESGERTDQFDRNPNTVEGLLQASRTEEFKWKCGVCLNFSTNTEKGMKIHIMRMHCNRQSIMEEPNSSTAENDNPEDPEQKHEWDANWIQSMAQKSRAGCETWVCSICLRTKAKSLHGIKVHIAKAHCLPKVRPIDDDKYDDFTDLEEEQEDSNEDDIFDSSFNKSSGPIPPIKSSKNKWIDRTIQKSEKKMKTENGLITTRWICAICKSFQGDSLRGIKLHIIKRHLKDRKRTQSTNTFTIVNKKFQTNPKVLPAKSPGSSNYHLKKSDLTVDERDWLSDQMNKSREIIGNQNAWKCRNCNKTFNVYTSMRYHLTSKHMKQMVVVNDGASTSQI